MMLFRAAALTINNPTADHRLLCVPVMGQGMSELEKRIKKRFGNSRVMVLIGDETAPTTGTPHLQVSAVPAPPSRRRCAAPSLFYKNSRCRGAYVKPLHLGRGVGQTFFF